MFIFEPEYEGLWGMAFAPQGITQLWVEHEAELLPLVEEHQVGGVGYLLPYGGLEFSEPVIALDASMVERLEKVVRFLPDQNARLLRLVRWGLERFPAAPHRLLCDSAFFCRAPAPALTYSLPIEYRQEGLVHLGAEGLLHAAVWADVKARWPMTRRLVSTRLGISPNVAAIRDGLGVDSTQGLPPVGGIPSSTGVGELDPSVIFALQSAGFDSQAIEAMIVERSGWKALAGRDLNWADLMDVAYEPARRARQAVAHALVHSLGAMLAALQGAERVHFTFPPGAPCLPFLMQISGSLRFCGVSLLPEPVEEAGGWRFTPANSPIQVSASPLDRRNVLAAALK